MRTSARNASHSVRTTDDRWNKAKARADREGVSLNFVLNELLDGYGMGLLNLPKVQVTKTYGPRARTVPAAVPAPTPPPG